MNIENLNKVLTFRHNLHKLAEASGQEEKTSEFVREKYLPLNPAEILAGLGGNGLAMVFRGKSNGPRIMLRCELDALPISETVEMEHASLNNGFSHKCGHDGHMAILYGVALHLQQFPIENGEVVLLYQPAEETGEGALKVLKSPDFSNLNFDYTFALHNLPGFNQGEIIIKEGIFAAASVGMRIELQGFTSHAGQPEKGKNPALAIASLIQDFSSIPQFHTSLEDAAKVTIINVQLGEEAFGTSPGWGKILITLRAYNQDVLEKMLSKCHRLAENTASKYDLDVEISLVEPFPPTVNDSKAVQIIEEVAGSLDLTVYKRKTAFPWSEDFGHFTQRYPGALFGLGSGDKHPSLHNPDYDFPDQIIGNGIKIFTGIIDKILKN